MHIIKNDIYDFLSRTIDINISDKDGNKLLEEIVSWDSYMIMNLLVEVESHFKRKIDLNRLFEIRTVNELVVLIEETLK